MAKWGVQSGTVPAMRKAFPPDGEGVPIGSVGCRGCPLERRSDWPSAPLTVQRFRTRAGPVGIVPAAVQNVVPFLRADGGTRSSKLALPPLFTNHRTVLVASSGNAKLAYRFPRRENLALCCSLTAWCLETPWGAGQVWVHGVHRAREGKDSQVSRGWWHSKGFRSVTPARSRVDGREGGALVTGGGGKESIAWFGYPRRR